METLQPDRADSLLRIAELEQRVEIAEQSARLKEGVIANPMKPQKQKSGRKKSEGKHDIGAAQFIAKIDDFQKIEKNLTSELDQKEEQRYQATQQVLTLREELSSSRHHIENIQQRYKEMVDEYQKIEGDMKQLLEIAPEDIPEDVDVRVLVSQLQARVNMFERENQQVKVHTKQQSRQIQIMKQEQEGIEVRMYMYVALNQPSRTRTPDMDMDIDADIQSKKYLFLLTNHYSYLIISNSSFNEGFNENGHALLKAIGHCPVVVFPIQYNNTVALTQKC